MKDTYPVVLKEKERALLESLANRGKGSARFFKRIMILLAVDAGKSYKEIESALNVSHTMIRFDEDVGWGSIQRVLANHKLKPWKKRCGASQN